MGYMLYMKEKIINTIINLFKIKTIITLATLAVFIILAYTEKLPMETTTMVIGMVFTYYFSKEHDGNL